LLFTSDPAQAQELAYRLEEQNRRRQEITRLAVERAYGQMSGPVPALVMVRDSDCPEGIVGLVAGRLQELYYRPAIVISEGPELSRASCRSIPDFHITNMLSGVETLLERYGGHAQAAGFTVRTDRLPELQQQLQQLAHHSLVVEGDAARLEPTLRLDAELPLHEITDVLDACLQRMAPFGEGNRQPLWYTPKARLVSARAVGTNGAHLQLRFKDRFGRERRGVAFRQGHRMAELGPVPTTVDIAYTLQQSEYNGETSTELHVTDFRFPLS
jgi:single-stranded-DNA-specific exonuclease